MMGRVFRLALIQLQVGADKSANVCNAVSQIKIAKQNGAEVVTLPECFNSPYGTSYFAEYAENIPNGPTCLTLSATAKDLQIYLVAGTIPEKDDSGKLYNSCTVWGPKGDLLAKHRKVHLFDIDIPGGITFKESLVLSPGNELTTFCMNGCKIGIGICYDIRFDEMARMYRKDGCDMLIYPGAFNMTTGPIHWELLHRARAVDNQLFVAGCSPARDTESGYVAYGHSLIVTPWGKILAQAKEGEEIIYGNIDLKEVEDFRTQIQVYPQRRTDIYDTIKK